LRLVAEARQVGAQCRACDVVERRRKSARNRAGYYRFEGGDDTLASGLTERDDAHAGEHQVCRDGVQVR